MSRNKKSFAKVFAPAVLLTAALALPIESLAALAPAPGFAAVQLDKDKDKDDKGKQKNKNQAKANPGQARKQQVQAQREQARKQQVAAQQQAQIRQQRIENQRQAQIRQQQIANQRQAEILRQRELQIARDRAAQQRAYDSRYTQNRGRGGADRSVIAADGILQDNGRCLILRGHEGQVYNLVGGTGGLREGEHVRLVGRLLHDRDSCGERMDVHQVQAIWADRNHRQTYFDHQRDGSFNNSYRERYADRYNGNYDDDYRYDDYNDDYDDRNDGRLLAREGRLYNTRSSCPVLRTDGGDFSLIGDLRNYREGEKVKVTGFLENGSRCGGDSLRVGEITRR